MFVLRVLLLGLALSGYFIYLHQEKQVDIAIVPIVTFSTIGVVIFLAGLLNIMVLASYLIILIGLTLLIVCKPWKTMKWNGEIKRNTALLAMFCCANILILLRLYREFPLHYDNFSHWLTVVQEMIHTDSMPNFQSSMICFEGYPTGSAGFIYFICKILAVSRDDLVLFAQAMLLVGALFSLMAFVKRVSVFQLLIVLGCSIYCLSANNKITDLLVDTLVSVLSIAVIVIAVKYREKSKKVFLLSLPLQMYLIAVKNSGILMVGINCVLMVCILLYANKKKLDRSYFGRIAAYAAGSLISCAAIYYLWMQHVKYVFDSGAKSKHTASVENYLSVFGEKTYEQIQEILINFKQSFFSWNTAWLLMLLFLAVLCAGMWYRCGICKAKTHPEPLIGLVIVGIYVGFMVVLAAMYLVSMPYDEAVVLASYKRYEYTILVYLAGIVCAYILHVFDSTPEKKYMEGVAKGAMLVITAVMLWTTSAELKELFIKDHTYESSLRYQLETLREEYQLPENSSYVVVAESSINDAGYCYYLSRYILWSTDVSTCTAADLSNAAVGKQYLVIVDESVAADQYLKDNGYTPGKRVYELHEQTRE